MQLKRQTRFIEKDSSVANELMMREDRIGFENFITFSLWILADLLFEPAEERLSRLWDAFWGL